jgi:glutamate carboxypeptidase
MKGGLVTGIFALKALDHAGFLEKIPIVFIFNSDEEIGSPTSRKIIRKEAKKSRFGLVLEAGGLNGEIVTGRKGNLSIEVNVRGKAGHAAFAGPDKQSAILEIAKKTVDFESLNNHEKGLTANVGLIAGGIGPNTVPEFASAKVDFRFCTVNDGKRVRKSIEKIVNNCAVPGVASDFYILSQRPPMPGGVMNKKLFKIFQDTAQDMGIPVIEEFRKGVSDANLIADEGVPVIDGLGPAGGSDHSRDEFIVRETLEQRALLLALSIIRGADFFEQ